MAIENLNQEIVQELKEKVATGCRILAKLGLADYLGHVSARVPGTKYVLIKARGVDLGNLLDMTPERVIMVDLEANHVEGKYRAPGEVKLHTEIFKARPDVMATVHTHQHLATAFGAAGKPILPMLGIMSVVCAKPMPVFHSSLKIVTADQGAAVARVLGDAIGCHLKNHGILMTGKSVEEAVINAIWLEMQAKVTMLATMIGTPSPQTPEEVQLNVEQAEPIAGRWRYYVSLLDLPYVTL
ncbi:MAG TPA: class II aldolase/adducin family protein [Syntrophorhabdales bacterium]|nr:class II aldolase/adducin family protein [Syntrophorhabdales bacterium]